MKTKYLILIISVVIISLVVLAVGVHAYYNNPRNTIDYARALFKFKLMNPNMTAEQNLQLARLDFLYKAGVINLK